MQDANTVQSEAGQSIMGWRQKKPLSMTNSRVNENLATHNAAPSEEEEDTPQNDPKSVNWEKRYGDLQSHTEKEVAKLVNANKDTLDEVVKLRKELENERSSKRVLPMTDAELEAVSEQYKPWDNLAQTRAIKAATEEVAPVKKELDELRKEIQDLKVEKARQRLGDLHPDYEKLEKDPEFISWVEQQPRGVQSLIQSSNIYDIAKGIDIYKNEKGIKTKTKRDRAKEASVGTNIDNAINPDGQGPKIWKRSEIKKLPPRVFEKYADDINKAAAEGRIVDE